MPSIHPDYEYDIFISYRQNDNKRDGWVTNFVDALRDELEATLKNPISIYFDENPHDGLLETHQVDASLAKKLKCLVFIPIISQTYCDESSFAWEQEFMPFIKMAKEDKLGMNITLSNGNVVSRVLPVKIHRLDIEDQNTLEAVLDGPLHSIGFIYQEAGVNRPLKPDDDRNLNLEKTDYHNQINKVANALKDIGTSLIKKSDGKITAQGVKTATLQPGKSSNRGIYIALTLIIIALLAYWGYKQFYYSPPAEAEDVTIAVLAFDDQSPNGDQEWLGDGMADEILNVLAKVDGLQVTGKTSSFSFKGKGLTTKEIGETLNVSTLLEGSVSKIGDKLRITAQLIDVETDAHIWSKKYDRDAADIFTIMDEVSQSIAGSLRSELSIEELEEIRVAYEVNPEAYEYYLRGVNLHWYSERRLEDFELSEQMFKNSIKIDSTYIAAYAGLADLYDTWDAWYGQYDYRYKIDSLIQIMFNIDPKSPHIALIKSFKFIYPPHLNFDSLFHYLHKAYILDPENFNNRAIIMSLTHQSGLYNLSKDMCYTLLSNDPLNSVVKRYLYSSLLKIGDLEKAKSELNKTLILDKNDFLANQWRFEIAVFYDKNYSEAKEIYKRLESINKGENEFERAILLAIEGHREEALITYSRGTQLYSILDMKKEALNRLDSLGTNQNYIGNYSYLNLVNLPHFKFIKDEPRFKEILAEAKKVHDERVAKYGHLFDE